MTRAWNQTRVSEVLGIEYPIIQGPLGGLSSQKITKGLELRWPRLVRRSWI
jgi:nitronate monooxygenase